MGGPKTFPLLAQYFPGLDFSSALTVKEGDQLSLGSHVLHFVSAPMVHWPEVMMSYESTEKVLFSADAFGKFGALDAQEDWDCEARRYYFNIVGKYGTQVQTVLKKAAGLDITDHLPPPRPHPDGDHPPLCWPSTRPGAATAWRAEGVFVAYASLHGNTAAGRRRSWRTSWRSKGCPKVTVADLARGRHGRGPGGRLPLRKDRPGSLHL